MFQPVTKEVILDAAAGYANELFTFFDSSSKRLVTASMGSVNWFNWFIWFVGFVEFVGFVGLSLFNSKNSINSMNCLVGLVHLVGRVCGVKALCVLRASSAAGGEIRGIAIAP